MNRFWSRIDIKGPDDCWEWQAGKSNTGYGSFYDINIKKTRNAHRVAWEITNGAIPKGKCILHKCDSKLCCNPNHLYCGTLSDNSRDRWNRTPIQSCWYISNTKLHDYEILEIRSTTDKVQESIAKQFDVSRRTISRILKSESFLCKEGYYL